MNPRRLIFFFFYLLGQTIIYSQNIDSLYRESQKGNPEKRIENLLTLGEIYLFENIDSAISVIQKAYELTQVEGHEKWQPDVYQLMGVYYSKTSNFDLGLKYSNLALDLKTKLEYPLEDIAEIEGNIASVYYKTADYEKALKHFQKSLEIFRSLESPDEGNAYINLGATYFEMDLTEVAMDYYGQAKDFFITTNNKKELANVYNHIGRIHQEKFEFEEAKTYFHNAIDIYFDINYKQGIANGYNNLAILFYYQEKKELALNYFLKALTIREEIGNHSLIIESYFNIGAFYQFENKTTESIPYFINAYEIAKSQNAVKELEESTFALSESYKSLKDYDSAYYYLSLCVNFKDSVYIKKIKALKSEVNFYSESASKKEEKEKPNLLAKENKKGKDLSNNSSIYKWITLLLICSLIVTLFILIKEKRKSN